MRPRAARGPGPGRGRERRGFRRLPRRGSHRRGAPPGFRSVMRASARRSMAVTTSVRLELGLDDLGAPLGTLVGEQPGRGRGGVRRERQQLFRVRRAHAAPGRVMDAAGRRADVGGRAQAAQRRARRIRAEALAHQVDDHGPELGVVPGRGRAGQRQAQLRRRLRRLGVEVVPDLHVVGHEPDRDDHGRRRRPPWPGRRGGPAHRVRATAGRAARSGSGTPDPRGGTPRTSVQK